MRQMLSIKTRLRLFLVTFAIVPLLIIGWNSYQTVYDERINQRDIDLKHIHLSQVIDVENHLYSVGNELLSMVTAASFFEDTGSKGKIDFYQVADKTKIQGHSPYLGLVEDESIQFVSGKHGLQKVEDWQLGPEKTIRYTARNINDEQVISISVNLFTRNEKRLVASVDIPINHLKEIALTDYPDSDTGVVIWRGKESINSAVNPGLQHAMKQNVESDDLNKLKRYEAYSYLLTDILDGQLLVGVASKRVIDDTIIAAIQVKYFVIVFILVALSLVLAIVYADHMYNPVRVIDRRSNMMIDGNLSTRITTWHSGIFKPIVESFNQVAENTERDYGVLMNQSMEMIEKQDELLRVNQSLEFNHDVLKKTNRKLQYSKEKYRKLIENVHDLVWVIDTEGRIVYVNEAFEEKLGRSLNSISGESFIELLADGADTDVKQQLIDKMMEKDFEAFHLWFGRALDDEAEPMLTNTVRLFKGGNLTGVQGISRSLSENWLLTQKLTRRSQALEDIRDITRSLATENNMDALFTLILQKIYELYDVVLCSIRTLNEEGHLELVTVTGPGSHVLTSESIKDQDDIRFKVLSENKMIYLEEISEDDLENYNDVVKASESTQSLVILPLADGDERTGVISVGFNEKLPQNELMILSTIGIQSTLAIKKADLYEKQREEFLATIRVLVTAIEAKDAYTEGHSNRVSEFATLIATEMGLTSQEIEDIQFAGLLHDIGKIGIDDFILTKKGRLSPFESDKIKEHPEIGERILLPIGFSKTIMDGVTLHHKRYDLKGYPENMEVESLPLSSAIIGVSDALDAMTSKRSYSEGRPLSEAIEEIMKNKMTQFDPQVVESIMRIYENAPGALENIITGKVQVMS